MPAEASPEIVKKVLFTALDVLRDYLSDIVIVGSKSRPSRPLFLQRG